MNSLVKDQLRNCKVAQLPPFDDDTTHMIIPKSGITVPVDIELDHYYLIELEDYIIHPYDGFDLHVNWNNNIVPKDKYMKCQICQIMGKMVKLESVGYDMLNRADTNNVWSGWVPRKSFKVIQEIT